MQLKTHDRDLDPLRGARELRTRLPHMDGSEVKVS